MNQQRENIIEKLKTHLEPNILNHSIALEACMGGLFDYFSEQKLLDENEPPKEDWLMAGLLHDVDYSGKYKEDHPNKTAEALKEYDIDASVQIIHIIKTHGPELSGIRPQTKAEWSIFCADSLTGLIVAVALILPSRKLEEVELSSVLKRFHKQPKFAAGTRRDEVTKCEDSHGLNIPVDKLIELCLNSMKKVSAEIGL